MRVDRCTVCATTIYDGDDEVCRHGWRTCLACDARDACEECNTEWAERARPRCLFGGVA